MVQSRTDTVNLAWN